MGLILTPSSTCAFSASSASLLCRTCFPQRVLTKVVRPAMMMLLLAYKVPGRGGRGLSSVGSSRLGGSNNLPVPEAPQTIRQNWMPFFICFLRRTFESETMVSTVYPIFYPQLRVSGLVRDREDNELRISLSHVLDAFRTWLLLFIW
jgi:hypothetical protein